MIETEKTLSPDDRVIYSCHRDYSYRVEFRPCFVVKETNGSFIIRHWDQYAKKWGHERRVRKTGMERHDNHYFETKDAALRYFASGLTDEVAKAQDKADRIDAILAEAVEDNRRWIEDRLKRAKADLDRFVTSNAAVIAETGVEVPA